MRKQQTWPGFSGRHAPGRSKDEAAERRRLRLAGFRALRAVTEAFAIEEKFIARRDEFEQQTWQKRRALIEAEMRRIAGVREDSP
jgi:hypothetical protein